MKTNINAPTIIAITGLIIAWDKHHFGALVFLASLGMLLFWHGRNQQQRDRENRSSKPTPSKEDSDEDK